MSVQLIVESAGSALMRLSYQNVAEKRAALNAFRRAVEEHSRSTSLDYGLSSAIRSFDLTVRELDALCDVVERAEPSWEKVINASVFLPTLNPDERFHYLFTFSFAEDDLVWPIADLNSLREVIEWASHHGEAQAVEEPDQLRETLSSFLMAIEAARDANYLLYYSI
ncbi:MAG: hypothetical protein IT365_27450 [Candidatus Hydrogenedentes bacterium]|nr:hypothetical protein [Candidatus Hydrogenedentota bacterium]